MRRMVAGSCPTLEVEVPKVALGVRQAVAIGFTSRQDMPTAPVRPP
jgi:hypothetical protein